MAPTFAPSNPRFVSHQPRRALSGLALALLAVGLLSLLPGCSKPDTPPAGAAAPGAAGGAPQALPVTVLEAQAKEVPVNIEIQGQSEGSKEVDVRAQASGILLQRLYSEGSAVKAGQPLFQLDPASYRNARDEAKARAEQAAREAARLQGLVDKQAVSQKEFDDAQSANAIAQASLRQAELNLSYTTVKAPVAGIAGRAQRSDGNLISSGSADVALTNIVQTDPIRVRFSLAESDLAALGKNTAAKAITGVEVLSADGKILLSKGKLDFAASQLDPKIGTLALRAEFANPQQTVLPGQFVRVRVAGPVRQGVFLLPQNAVLQGEKGYFVMLAGEGKEGGKAAEPRPVQVAEWLGKDWVITGGLKAGDQVIIDNLIKLRPGAPVAPHGPQQPPAEAPKAAASAAAPAAK